MKKRTRSTAPTAVSIADRFVDNIYRSLIAEAEKMSIRRSVTWRDSDAVNDIFNRLNAAINETSHERHEAVSKVLKSCKLAMKRLALRLQSEYQREQTGQLLSA